MFTRNLSFFVNLKEKTERLGLCEVSFLNIKNPSRTFQNFYKQYLKKKFHADMKYLENIKPKFNLNYLCTHGISKFKANSMLVGLYPYRHIKTEKALKESPFKIARYAWGLDYHIQLKKKIKTVFKADEKYRIMIDSTPLPERYYARQAGLGFIGRNGMLINSNMGSYFFLVFILLSHKLSFYEELALKKKKKFKFIQPHDTPQQDIATWCGECRLCVVSCPTNALPGDGEVNANLCISYWNIESKSESIALNKKIGKWIFGCDICQKVCPYNKKSVFTLDEDFAPQAITRQIARGDIANLKKNNLKGLPLQRSGLKGLKRNIDFLMN